METQVKTSGAILPNPPVFQDDFKKALQRKVTFEISEVKARPVRPI